MWSESFLGWDRWGWVFTWLGGWWWGMAFCFNNPSYRSLPEGLVKHKVIPGRPVGCGPGRTLSLAEEGEEAGLVEDFDALINHSTKNEKGFYKSIFDDRNNAWMPRVRSYLRAPGNHPIIVGSGHLVGKNGLVNQLRREGYTVEQL